MKDYPDTRVIILTLHYDAGLIAEMIKMGTSYFFAKDTDPDNLIIAVREVLKKDFIIKLLRERMLYG